LQSHDDQLTITRPGPYGLRTARAGYGDQSVRRDPARVRDPAGLVGQRVMKVAADTRGEGATLPDIACWFGQL